MEDGQRPLHRRPTGPHVATALHRDQHLHVQPESRAVMLHGAPLSAAPPAAIALPLAVSAVLYVRGLGRINATRPRVAAFIAGWAVLGLALATPLHSLGERALAWHMVQHVLLMAVAAPLLVWSRPGPVLLRGLPDAGRRLGIGIMRGIAPAVDALTGVVVAAILHAIVLWAWHAPGLYSAGVRNALIHDAQHVSLLTAALIFWASVVIASARRNPTGAAVLSLFITTLHMSLLAVLMTFARTPWYDAYASNPGALEDQQVAGLIMWIPGALPYVFAALGVVWLMLTRLPRVRTRNQNYEMAASEMPPSRPDHGTSIAPHGIV